MARKINAEDRQKAIEMIVDNVKLLLTLTPDDGRYWTATCSDLVELSHVAWETGEILDGRGRPMTFLMLSHHLFNILHAREPKSPTSVWNKVMLRKNVRTLPLVDRYANLMAGGIASNPMLTDIAVGAAS